MGVTSNPTMHFNISELVHRHPDLSALVMPFLKEEIDLIVKHLPSDKAPGPDGFNGVFMKKCWDIIKPDFYKLCEEFYNGELDLQSINNSYITLVPKISNPESINDYRPISLLNSSIKLLTKILADRL